MDKKDIGLIVAAIDRNTAQLKRIADILATHPAMVDPEAEKRAARAGRRSQPKIEFPKELEDIEVPEDLG
jgi:hypothetical protein